MQLFPRYLCCAVYTATSKNRIIVRNNVRIFCFFSDLPREGTNSFHLLKSSMAAKSLAASGVVKGEIRRVVIVNHGETVDKVFGHEWTKFYDDDGNLKCSRAFSAANYVTFEDGNLPISLMDRAEMLKAYDRDPPLTEVGKLGMMEVGYALGAAGVSPDKMGMAIYSSPMCACIESAHYLCKGLGMASFGGQPRENDGIQIRIENGLIMQLGHDSRMTARNLPKWLTADEIHNGLRRQMDTGYKHAVTDLQTETVEEYYARMRRALDKILASVPNKREQTLIMVAHASTLEGCTRPMYNAPLRRQRDFDTIVRQIPFCFSVRLSERGANKWDMTEPLVPGVTYSTNDAYRWEAFGDANEMRKVLKK